MGHVISSFSILQLAAITLAVVVLSSLANGIYNVYFHPLAKFPGPRLWALSDVLYLKHWISGKWPLKLDELHRKYGPVVRIAPNDLSFATLESYQEIYGHSTNGHKTMVKGSMYTAGAGELEPSIVSERDPVKHREVRKTLSHAFSAKALREQTGVVIKYVDQFMLQVAKQGDTSEGIDMADWFNWLTFDIIGDLAFGQAFGACAEGRAHPWVKDVLKSVFTAPYRELFYRLPWTKPLSFFILPKGLLAARKHQIKESRERVLARLESENDRDDFFSHLLSEKSPDVSEEFLITQANTLIIAGSETTATALAGITYYLTSNQAKLQRLTQEIRTAFSEPLLINGDTTQDLPYLHGVIEEGLRMFPPVAFGLQRICPGTEIGSYYVPAGTTVSTAAYTTSHSEEFWHLPWAFNPERWLPKDHPLYDPVFANDNRDASHPFSLGPRVCLGINLAYVELRIVLARLCLEFDWELKDKNLDWKRDTDNFFLWSKPVLPIRYTAKKT